MNLTGDMVLRGPALTKIGENGVVVLVDREGPNWMGTDARGAEILGRFDGGTTLEEVARRHAEETGSEWAKAWQHVETIARDAVRQGLLGEKEREEAPYRGRETHLEGARLTDLWLHTNQSCNLACRHCLVSSGPQGGPGLSADVLLDVIGQARSLGAKRFYFTGGEPLIRKDFAALAAAALADPEAELAVLTNGVLLREDRLAMLETLPKDRLRLQISLDGSEPGTNDPIRGAGSFPRICAGIRAAIQAGFHVTVTTAITRENAEDVPAVTRLVAALGGTRHHLLWLHKRGRAAEGGTDETPEVSRVIEVVRRAREVGREVGVLVDNHESVRARIAGRRGVKRDLTNACVSSLCVYVDGSVYPSAAMVDIPELRLGSVLERPLAELWRESPVARDFRSATVLDKEICRTCPLKFLCGGGDVEHSYFYGGSIRAHDPYCELHRAMFADAMVETAAERREIVVNPRSGNSAPVAFAVMGEGSDHCAANVEDDAPVVTGRSECVLSYDLDAPRALVREFYGRAAETPDAELCCPVRPDPEDLEHIPAEVVERFYGCGSPVGDADIKEGETTLDLGSGAGIDVFIAAKKVGPRGRAIGIDMTDRMLEVANEARTAVAKSLGFDVVEFRRGFLEEIPAESASVDLVTSNCVLNLSPDKKKVFADIWRVLRDHGRIVIADIVSEEEVPLDQRRDPRLWGECISGALTEEEFLAYLERAGFYGLEVLKKTFWKEVDGYRFHSLTVRGFKFEKKAGCVFLGHRAIYQGPMKGIADEEGHWFPRGTAVEVCTDSVSKLSAPPYAGMFVITDPDGRAPDRTCDPDGGCC